MHEWRHRGTRAVQRLVEHAPASGGLALWARHADRPSTDAEGPATERDGGRRPVRGLDPGTPCDVTTDGQTLFYGPGFAALPLPLQTGLVAHGVLHIALRHVARRDALQRHGGDVDAQLFNLCADAIVNTALSHLAWLRLPDGAVRLEPLLEQALGLRMAPEAALLAWDVERLYRAIDDRASPSGRPAAGGDDPSARSASPPRTDGPRARAARALAAGQPQDLLPAPRSGPQTEGDTGSEGRPPGPEDEAQAEHDWRERLLRAHTGDGEHSLLRTLLADLPRSRTPWPQVLRTQLARALAPRPDLSWSRPTRAWLANRGRTRQGQRLPWEPGVAGTRRVPRLAVVLDNSGSIDEPLLQRLAGELESIRQRLGAALVLVVGDDRVRAVHHLPERHQAPRRTPAPLAPLLQASGGGGTDFTPLLEEAERHGPDITVVLTDLQGPARHRPRHPVLWAVPPAWAHAQPPFGRLLVLHG
jgi:predicted metal-dependent peptidase